MKLLRPLLLGFALLSVAACSAGPKAEIPVAASVAPAEVKVAPPTAPAAVSAALPRAFTVHFDFASAEIRASAMQILWEAAQVAPQVKPVAVRIHGYTDARGSRAYNKKLSERRAAAVAAQLVKLGITVDVVEVIGHGVAKGKGREARKVEIVFETAQATAKPPAGDTLSAAKAKPKAWVAAARAPLPALAAPAPVRAVRVVALPAEEPMRPARQAQALVHRGADPPGLAPSNFNQIPE